MSRYRVSPWELVNVVVGIVFMGIAVNAPSCPKWLWYASALWAVSIICHVIDGRRS